MPVFDASVVVDALVAVGPAGDSARAALRGQPALQVPAILPAEVVSALAGLVRRGELALIRARAAIEQTHTLRTIEHGFGPFRDRVWELRENVTVYDGWYVALAEHLGSDLITADERLAGAAGPRCRVVHVRHYGSVG